MIVQNELPGWLDESVLKEIVNIKFNGKDTKIIHYDKCNVSNNSGDHYLSEITHFWVKVFDGERENSINFVIKDMSKGLTDFLIDANGVEKEVSMYKDIIPFVNKMLPAPISPEMYYVSSDKCLVLDDLSSSGYVLADRIALLDYDHCKVALKALAQLHGATVGLYEVSPQIFTIVGEETLYDGNKDAFSYHFGVTNMNNVITMLKKIPEGAQFIEGVEQFSSTFWDDINDVFKKDHGFNVLNHGDFWTTNILFKYENGIVSDCKLLDFQITRFFCPTYDLYQFITISMKSSVRDNNLSELLDVYVDNLNQTLKIIGSSSNLPRKALDKMMDDTKGLGLLCALTLTEIALCDAQDPLELSTLRKEDIKLGFPNGDPYAKGYTQKPVQEHIISLLHFFRKRKYI